MIIIPYNIIQTVPKISLAIFVSHIIYGTAVTIRYTYGRVSSLQTAMASVYYNKAVILLLCGSR